MATQPHIGPMGPQLDYEAGTPAELGIADHLALLEAYTNHEDSAVNFAARTVLAHVAEQDAAIAELVHQATHDDLTGALNRKGLFGEAAKLFNPQPGHAVVAYMIDLDGFKPVNDEHGHAVGDQVLQDVVQALTPNTDNAILARMGGDEFVILKRIDTTNIPNVEQSADDEKDQIAAIVQATSDASGIPYGASVGRSSLLNTSEASGSDIGKLLAQADGTMYKHKNTKVRHRR